MSADGPSRRIVIGTMALAPIWLNLAACKEGEEFRFRVTVEVETPQGMRSGSSVMELAAWRNTIAANGHVRGRSLRGEAVVVELPKRRKLFVLPRTYRPEWRTMFDVALDTLDPQYRNDWVESVERVKNGARPRTNSTVRSYRQDGTDSDGAFPVSNWPVMVTFADTTKPETVAQVDPEHLDESFGTGYRIRRIKIERTDDPVTDNIRSELPWFDDYWQRGAVLAPDPPIAMENSDEPGHLQLSAGDFVAMGRL